MTVDPIVSARMSRTKGRDTAAELAVRRALHARRWRYRVNIRPVEDVRRTGDIVFTRRKVVVLIDGCFWHGCPQHFVVPKTRTDWWVEKIAGNKRRDDETLRLWSEAGWRVLRFWEHEPPSEVVAKIEDALLEESGPSSAGNNA